METLLASILSWLGSFVDWILKLVLWIPEKVWALLLDALANVILALPVPDWIASIPALFSMIPGSVWYFASVCQLDVGLSMVISAYVLRFIIRRLPVVG